MENLDPPGNPVEYGRFGSEAKAIRVATQKSERNKAFMRAAIGIAALAVSSVATVGAYVVYDNHANDPEVMENWKISEQIKLQVARDKLSHEQKIEADKAIAEAQKEAAAALKKQQEQDAINVQEEWVAARPTRLLEQMFKQTSISEAVCSPSNIELTASFKPDETIKEFSVNMPVSRDDTKWGMDGNDAYMACEQTFTMEKFASARGLELLPSIAHYNQLKDMWNLCRAGFTEEGPDYDANSDGSADLYYQLYAKDYYMNSAQEYKAYTECMSKALGHPLIRTGQTPMAAIQ